jgi:signal transduction histidine kinase
MRRRTFPAPLEKRRSRSESFGARLRESHYTTGWEDATLPLPKSTESGQQDFSKTSPCTCPVAWEDRPKDGRRKTVQVPTLPGGAPEQAELTVSDLLALSQKLNSTLDVEGVMDCLVVEGIRLSGAEGGFAGVLTPGGMACHKYFLNSRTAPFKRHWPGGVGIPGWVLVHKVPFLTNRAWADRLLIPEIGDAGQFKSALYTPLLGTQGESLGFFEVHNKNDGAGFTDRDVERMLVLARLASVSLQHALCYRRVRQAEEELRQLSGRLLRLQDEERRHMARELHDTTGQTLATVAMRLDAARGALGKDDSAAEQAVAESLDLVRQCAREISTMSYLRHPPLLEEQGLASALAWYAEGFARRSGIHVDWHVPRKLGRLPQCVETALFRIVQESLTNIHVHSGSPTAEIRIVRSRSAVTLEVRDAGRGMSREKLQSVPTGVAGLGVGIAGMRERVRQLGGCLEVESDRWGTAVRATLPRNGGTP